jgi:hypothetical protein
MQGSYYRIQSEADACLVMQREDKGLENGIIGMAKLNLNEKILYFLILFFSSCSFDMSTNMAYARLGLVGYAMSLSGHVSGAHACSKIRKPVAFLYVLD